MLISNPISNIFDITTKDHDLLDGLLDDDHTNLVDVAGLRAAAKIISGNDAAKSGTPTAGDIYVAIDTERLYICRVANTWQEYPSIFVSAKGVQGQVLYHNGTRWVALGVGTSGQFLRTKGAGVNPDWASAPLPILAPSDDNVAVLATERNDNSTSYIKIKEVSISTGGTYRISFQMKIMSGSFAARGKIYRNGSPVGTERSTNQSTYQTFTEDIAGWLGDDLVQLYIYTTASGWPAYIQQFLVRGLLRPEYTINLN